MTRNRLLALAIAGITAVLVTAVGAPPPAQVAAADKGQVLLIAKEYTDDPHTLSMMIQKEVNPIIAKLTDAGYSVVVASESGANITAGSVQLSVTKKLSDVRVEDYVGIILPCMAFGNRPIPTEAVEIVKAANSRGVPIAAQQSSVLILGSAGVLKDRKYAIFKDYKYLVKDGTYSGMGVVHDGNIVTSGTCPTVAAYTGQQDGTDELVSVFLGMLKG